MEPLVDYVVAHTERGECQCGKCVDKGEDRTLPGHTANLVFFEVCAKGEPNKETFLELIRSHQGVFGDVDPLDGQEHNYMELGGWIGDQGLAMQTMGLGVLLNVWRLLTPFTMLGNLVDKNTAMQMAGMGYVAIQAV